MVFATSGKPGLTKWLAGGVGLLALTVVPVAQAGSPQPTSLNSAALILMEEQADRAKPREQCYLYTQLVEALTEAASRQIAAGDDEDAGKTVVHIDAVAAKLQNTAARDAKKLKDAEKMLGESARRLKDLSRIANSGERDEMRAMLLKVDAAHNKLLSLVFLQ